MSETPAPLSPEPLSPEPAATAVASSAPARPGWWSRAWVIRQPIPLWQGVLSGTLCVVCCLAIWWFLTAGETVEERIWGPTKLPSPGETFAPETISQLWYERALSRNTLVSLRRVFLGFLSAAVVGIPLGIVCGCFPRIDAFFTPLTIFGRNIPMAALIPLTFNIFGLGEVQKVMFLFLACVPFVLSGTADAVKAVSGSYIDTAYTLGASRSQVIFKVLTPLAMPVVFDSLRVLFGLAFGYIMLAELVKLGEEAGGLGNLIELSQKRGPREHILLILLVIPILAWAIDRALWWIQKELFPHRYGGTGLLMRLVRAVIHLGGDVLASFRSPVPIPGEAPRPSQS